MVKIRTKKTYQKSQKKAFSLIELSVVILIISILVSGGLSVSKTSIYNYKVKVTNERMDKVYSSLASFVLNNKRLPCPAPLDVAKGVAEYGWEALNQGTCTNITLIDVTDPYDLVYGMIPVSTLGLSPEYGEDGFGTKFSYVAAKSFTQVSSGVLNDGFETIQAMPSVGSGELPINIINIQNNNNGTNEIFLSNALFVIISHGNNKDGGWNATGTSQNPDGNASEVDNKWGDPNITFTAYSTDSSFDDIVLFKDKTQLLKDAGAEFMLCIGQEASVADTADVCDGAEWDGRIVVYGEDSLSSTGGEDCTRKCGKYGVWGSSIPYVANVSKYLLRLGGDGQDTSSAIGTVSVAYGSSIADTFGGDLSYNSTSKEFTNNSGSTMNLMVSYSHRFQIDDGITGSYAGWIRVSGGPGLSAFFAQSYSQKTINGDIGVSGSSIIILPDGENFTVKAYKIDSDDTLAQSISDNNEWLASLISIYQIP
jgi:prepilin-type N-terminal cleavage/methylation domain-containing protein